MDLESNPLRGLFGVSSPRPEPQLVSPQPTTPTEDIYYQIPLGMIEKLPANPYAGDGMVHPDMHWKKFVDCLSLQVYPEMELRRKYSHYLWRERH